MGKLGGEDAEFFASIFQRLAAQVENSANMVLNTIRTPVRMWTGEVLALIVNGESVQSASLDDQVEVILPKTGFYIESGGQVNDEGYIRAVSFVQQFNCWTTCMGD